MWTEFVEVPVAILLHLVWRVDGQGPVGVHRDHHTANVRLQVEGEEHKCVRLKLITNVCHEYIIY